MTRFIYLLFAPTNLLLLQRLVRGQPENQLRLVGGSRSSQGRVEIYHNATWGTICDDTFDKNTATVVCHQLPYTGSLFTPRSQARFGSGTGPIWLDDFSCTGSEGRLTDCLLKPWGVNNCNHNEDAGVDCDPIYLQDVGHAGRERTDAQGTLDYSTSDIANNGPGVTGKKPKRKMQSIFM